MAMACRGSSLPMDEPLRITLPPVLKRHLVTASAAAAIMLVLAPLLSLSPRAALAAIVIVYLVGLIEPTPRPFRVSAGNSIRIDRWCSLAAPCRCATRLSHG